MIHFSSAAVSSGDHPNCRYCCSIRCNSSLSSWWGVCTEKSLSVLSQSCPWMQINLDPGSFDAVACARDAAREAGRGAEMPSPLHGGQPWDSGTTTATERPTSLLAVVGEWWVLVRVAVGDRVVLCACLYLWPQIDAVTLGQKGECCLLWT
jgi:hypothetical protein